MIALVHTVPGLVADFDRLVAEYIPGAELHHVVDEGLLQRTIARGRLEDDVQRDLAAIVERIGADAELVLVTCSTLGPAVDAIAEGAARPVVRVDEAMGRRALQLGSRLGVLATLTSTLEPTVALLERLAAEQQRPVEVVAHLCEGAFAAVKAGDGERHDELVRDGLARLLEQDVEVVVLAQASMARVLDTLGTAPPVPVLSSPALAVEHVARLLADR